MVDDTTLQQQLNYVLERTALDQSQSGRFSERYEGKVRDTYRRGAERILITTDRLSCFDVVLTTIPFKGQILNTVAGEWFRDTAHIVANHLIDIPHPNVMVCRSCEIVPIEVVVRSHLAGSAWRDYEAGRAVSGIILPAGLRQYAALPELLVTPATKAARGVHDEPISEQEIVRQRIVPNTLWQEIRETALALFRHGQARAAGRGLILVDTKYEFGLVKGKLHLADEIHTLDCSRYWLAESYPGLLARGESPQMLDKEPVRQWLLSQGYKGEGTPPVFSSERRIEIARHYLDCGQQILGQSIKVVPGEALSGIERALGS